MNGHERIFGELADSAGPWSGSNSDMEADFPHAESLPWEGLSEDECSVEKIKSEDLYSRGAEVGASNSESDHIVLGRLFRSTVLRLSLFIKALD